MHIPFQTWSVRKFFKNIFTIMEHYHPIYSLKKQQEQQTDSSIFRFSHCYQVFIDIILKKGAPQPPPAFLVG